jgi:hypothetical protein
MSFEDIKDLSVTALIGKMMLTASDDESKSELERLMKLVRGTGIADKRVASLGLGLVENKD